jgi:outer membrane protein
MRKILAAGCLAAALSMGVAGTAAAQDASAPVSKQAGTFMVRLRALGVIPLNSSSSVTPIGGTVDASATATPEVDFSYFFTDHIAAELIAATAKTYVSAKGTAIGDVNVGNVWVLPPTLTLQYHFLPHERFSPYLGAGINVSFFYSAKPSGYPITSFGLSNAVGPALQAGFDYNLTGHWFLNVDIKQIFIKTTARINGGAVKANDWVNPLIIGAGIGYRF